MTAEAIKQLALDCGFDLAGIARAEPTPEAAHYQRWVEAGMAGAMGYLTGRRAELRNDPRSLLPSARSILCVGKLYNTDRPYSTASGGDAAWISRYAWGDDYHDVLRDGLNRVVTRMQEAGLEFEHKICVDTAPILERVYARYAGLGWIGKNTCLINEPRGSWFFLGELLLSLELSSDCPPPNRCGTCTRCIDACPTKAIVPTGHEQPSWQIDSRLCISYFTIELHGPMPEDHRAATGRHVFGCDICQDVCPWNRRAPVTDDAAFQTRWPEPPLEKLAALQESEFAALFRGSPVSRARHRGFLRNVAVAMGNARREEYRDALERLAASDDTLVAEHARWALNQLESRRAEPGTS
jgi:epoxyqueuosine reductase